MWVKVLRRAAWGTLPKAFLMSSEAIDSGRGIINNGLEEEDVFVATLTRSGTFLLRREEVVGNGIIGHSLGEDRH